MNVALWIAAALLAVVFMAAGLMKLSRSRGALVEAGQGWAEDFSDGVVRGIGALEVLASIALIVPGLIDLGGVIVPLAAVGLAAMMVGAAITHARRHEYANVAINVMLAALAVFVAIGRFGAYQF